MVSFKSTEGGAGLTVGPRVSSQLVQLKTPRAYKLERLGKMNPRQRAKRARWQSLHGAAKIVGCPTCRRHGRNFMPRGSRPAVKTLAMPAWLPQQGDSLGGLKLLFAASP